MANPTSSESNLPQRAETTNPDWNAYVPQGHGRTDEQIRGDVHQLIEKENGKRTKALSVSVSGGVVTLRGHTSGATEQARLIAALRNVPSVRDVVDQLEIDPAPATQRAAELASTGVSAARDRAYEIAQRTQEVASNVADQARDYGHELSVRAREYGQRAGDSAVRGARTAGDFVSTHAVPLALVGASLGYLFWSIQREREQRTYDAVAYDIGVTRRDDRRNYRVRAPEYAPTTTGEKLLGVRSDYYGA